MLVLGGTVDRKTVSFEPGYRRYVFLFIAILVLGGKA